MVKYVLQSQLYITLSSRTITNGLNSGNYSFRTDRRQIVEHILDMLENYLTSFQNLEVDDSFKINVKVLSINHTREMRESGRPVHVVGAFSVVRRRSWCFEMPKISAADDENMCLPFSIIVGEAKERNGRSYAIMSAHNKGKRASQDDHKLALSEIKGRFLEIQRQCPNLRPVTTGGKFELESTCQLLAGQLAVQIFVFDPTSEENLLYYKYPTETDFSRPLVMLYLDRTNSHVYLILRYKVLLRQCGYRGICFGCGQKTKGHDLPHRCLEFSSCYACRRIYSDENTFLGHHPYIFCNGKHAPKDDALQGTKCEGCNFFVQSSQCKVSHKLNVCNCVYKCDKCKKVTWKNGKYRNQQALKQNHSCNSRKCKVCFDEVVDLEDHFCRMKKPSESGKQFPRLAFSTFELNYVDGLAIPVFGTLIYEDSPGEFFQHQFDSEQTYSRENPISCRTYWGAAPKPKFAAKKTTFKNGLNSSFVNFQTVTGKVNNRLLSFLLAKRPGNCSLVVKNDTDMSFIMSAATDLGLEISVVAKQRTLINVNLKNSGVAVLNSESYFALSTEEMNKIFGVCPESDFYFPSSLSFEDNYKKQPGKTPAADEWILFEDNSDIRRKKKEFVQGLNLNWSYAEGIKRLSSQRTIVLLWACTSLISDGIELQNQLGIKDYFHPFANYIFTRAAFLYTLFLACNSFDLYALPYDEKPAVKDDKMSGNPALQ